MYSAALRVNERHDHEETVRKLDQLFSEASSSLDSETNHLVSQVISYSREISSFAHEYDFEDVHANGFRILLALTVKILRRGLSTHKRGDKFRDQFTCLLQSMVSAIDHLKKLREITKSSGIPLTTDREFFVEVMQRYAKSHFEAHEPIHDTFAGVAFGMTGNVVRSIRNVLVLLFYSESKTLLRCLFNNNLWIVNLDRRLRNFDLMFLKFLDKLVFNSSTKVLMKILACTTNVLIGLPPWPQTILVPRQTKFMLVVDANNNPVFGVEKDSHRLCWGLEEVRCLYTLKPHESGEPPDAVILDAHGGAFVTGCPEMHLVYCQRWAQRMPGVGVLQVRYTVCPDARFPVQIQQMLDVYMWLISGNESVKEKIGFHPKKIVLAGDSAGALFVTSLLVVLNEIRKRLDPELRMPVAVFSFYGAFSIFPLVSAAKFASPFHYLLLPSILMAASRNYRPEIETKNNSMSQTKRKYSVTEIHNLLQNPPPNVFEKETESIRQYLERWDSVTGHPFLSPMSYDDFDSLSDVELHCTSTHSEPILDSTIAMLKKWKGKASLTMMGDLVHGHLILLGVNRQHNQAFEQTVEKFRSVLQIPSSDCHNSSVSFFQLATIAGLLLAFIVVCYWMSVN